MKLDNIVKKTLLIICTYCLILIAAAIIYYRSLDCLPFIFGVLLGWAGSIARVFLLSFAVDKVLEKEEREAKNFARLQHLLRLFIVAAVLTIGAIVPQISLWGTAASIFSLQVAMYVLKIFSKK